MKKIFPILMLFAALGTGLSVAQAQRFGFQYNQLATVTVNGRALPNAWAGGLNSCQFAQTRLDDDTRPDLVVFDRTSFKVSTFLATDAGWQYAPDYEKDFPAIQSWLALADFDNDGLTDLFAPIATGIGVFRHVRANGRPTWQLVANPLMTIGLSSTLPLYVSGADIPAIVDYDDDGDIDILTFDETGNKVTYFKNQAVETKNPSRLAFKRIGECWGNFRKEFCNDFHFDLDCASTFGQSTPGNGAARVAHNGNALAVMDTDGDGFKDLLFGFVSCTNLARLKSVGPNSEHARFTSADTLFPAKNPVNLTIFPAAYVVDLDRDGLRDLVASPNLQSNDAGNSTDFQASNWFYHNAGTAQKPDFQLVQTNFLQDDMIDLGEDAVPALADLDGDGDLDMLLGGRGQRQADGGFRATLRLFTNKGSASQAAFELTNADYLSLPASLTATSVGPAFADVDGNGSQDLVLSLTTPATGNQVRVLLNTAPAGTAAQYNFASARLLNLPDLIFTGEHPTFADIDRDGNPDVLVGDAAGNVRYYRNTGTATAPTYAVQSRSFGGLGVNLLARYPSIVVADLNGDRQNELLTATRDGAVRIYALPSQPTGNLTLLDSLPGLSKPGAGLVTTMGDLDGDQLPDLLLGTLSGGVRYLKNTSTKVTVTGLEPTVPGKRTDLPWAYPNPTDGALTVKPPRDGVLDLIDLNGQVILPGRTVQHDQTLTLNIADQPDAVYLLRLTTDGQPPLVEKIVLWK